MSNHTWVERPESDMLRMSLRSTAEERVRVIRVLLSRDDQTTTPADLIGTTVPELGSGHPLNPDLVLQDIEGSWVDDSARVYEFRLRYSYPSGSLSWPQNYPARLRVHLTTAQDRVYVDLDGEPIGSPHFAEIVDERDPPEPLEPADWINPDAEVGTLVRTPRAQVDVEVSTPAPWNTRWVEWLGAVSAESMWGLPPGRVQYIGASMEEQYDPLKNARNLYTGTLSFIAGGLTVHAGGQEIELDLDERLVFKWRKRITPDGVPVVEPMEHVVHRVHVRKPLTQLIPVVPR